jgi:hypothetical protein
VQLSCITKVEDKKIYIIGLHFFLNFSGKKHGKKLVTPHGEFSKENKEVKSDMVLTGLEDETSNISQTWETRKQDVCTVYSLYSMYM